MPTFADIITDDELFTDAFDYVETEDGTVEVTCKMITVKAQGDVDIGSDASAEEAAEGPEEGASQSVNNVVHSMRLQPTAFDKRSYSTYLNSYMKQIKPIMMKAGKSEDEMNAFDKHYQTVSKRILGSFKDYEFYTGASMNPTGMVALLNNREDGTPFLTFWKDGLKEIA